MAQTVASSYTAASLSKSYHVFISHRGPDVKKTFASHLYHRLSSPHVGLRVFLDQPELKVGDNFPDQIKDAIRTASVHVAIFSEKYADSEWCLNELLYMLESGAPMIPVFYGVQRAQLPQTEGLDQVYAKSLTDLENKRTMEQKPRHSPATIQKWKEALSLVSRRRGFDLQNTCNGDQGELVELIVQRVLKEIDILSVGISGFYCSPPYGGTGPHDRSDGTYSGIRRVTTTVKDHFLTSVQLHYGLEGDESLKDRYFLGTLHGREDGSLIVHDINFPEEFVTKISGYFGRNKNWPLVIKSLTFHTNRKKYGPCGQEEGTYFESGVGGKIVGLFASSGTVVDSIGVYMLKPITSKNEVFYCSQLFGGHGGDDWNDGTYSGIKRITMTSKDHSLTSVQLQYTLEGDESGKDIYIFGLRHGSAAGVPIEYNLNHPHEIVTKISGYFGSDKSLPAVIKSLTFHTNKGKYGPCGQEEGTPFETEEGGKIVGFFGSSGTAVDSIGVYMLKSITSRKQEFYCPQVYGGDGGSCRSDGTYSGIRRITTTVNDNLLASVQLHYGLEGDEGSKDRYFHGPLHGREGGPPITHELNYPDEIVTKISGYLGSYKSCRLMIKSLTFHTNQRKLAPCGQEQGTYFESKQEGKIVGIFASSGSVVDSIGVYELKPRTSRDEVSEADRGNKSDQNFAICHHLWT